MKAALLFESRQVFGTASGMTIVMEMNLYELPAVEATADPGERYRFSWIAFDQADPAKRILFDCHAPKGTHFHIDDDKDGSPFVWSSLSDAIQLFQKKVTEHFGELSEISDEGGQYK